MPNPMYNNPYGQPQQGFDLNAFLAFANNFKQNSSKTPEQVVRELLANGTMTQEQFNSFRNTANMLTNRNM